MDQQFEQEPNEKLNVQQTPRPELLKTAKQKFIRIILIVLLGYFIVGLIFNIGSLICYNISNWQVMGGFSWPPLYLPYGFFLELFIWPIFLWANLINYIGIFGSCQTISII